MAREGVASAYLSTLAAELAEGERVRARLQEMRDESRRRFDYF
jgi:hypothetical protein